MIKKFTIDNNIVEVEVKESLSITEQLTIQSELQHMVVSRDFGYMERMIEPLYKALILKHTTDIEVEIEYDELIDFMDINKDIVTEIVDLIDPNKEMFEGCLKAIEFRKNNFTGLMIYDLMVTLNPIVSFVNQIANNNIVSDEMVEKLSNLSDAIKDLDTVEVAKALAAKEG